MSYRPILRAMPSASRVARAGLPPGIHVPHHGMPSRAVFAPTALGYTVSIKTPWGKESFSIPFEQVVQDVANMAVNAAWPVMRQHLYNELPTLMEAAFNEAQPYFRKEIDRTMGIAERKIDDTMDKATTSAAIGLAIAIVAGTGLVIFSKIKKRGA